MQDIDIGFLGATSYDMTGVKYQSQWLGRPDICFGRSVCRDDRLPGDLIRYTCDWKSVVPLEG